MRGMIKVIAHKFVFFISKHLHCYKATLLKGGHCIFKSKESGEGEHSGAGEGGSD